jgi:hypothetical protein
MILLQACGCDGFGAPVAEDEFQEDGGRRANEETPVAKLPQIHLRIGYGEPVELAPHPFMVIQAKGDVIDRLAGPVDRAALARNEVYDRPSRWLVAFDQRLNLNRIDREIPRDLHNREPQIKERPK